MEVQVQRVFINILQPVNCLGRGGGAFANFQRVKLSPQLISVSKWYQQAQETPKNLTQALESWDKPGPAHHGTGPLHFRVPKLIQGFCHPRISVKEVSASVFSNSSAWICYLPFHFLPPLAQRMRNGENTSLSALSDPLFMIYSWNRNRFSQECTSFVIWSSLPEGNECLPVRMKEPT